MYMNFRRNGMCRLCKIHVGMTTTARSVASTMPMVP
jgi:hypothetical protein